MRFTFCVENLDRRPAWTECHSWIKLSKHAGSQRRCSKLASQVPAGANDQSGQKQIWSCRIVQKSKISMKSCSIFALTKSHEVLCLLCRRLCLFPFSSWMTWVCTSLAEATVCMAKQIANESRRRNCRPRKIAMAITNYELLQKYKRAGTHWVICVHIWSYLTIHASCIEYA